MWPRAGQAGWAILLGHVPNLQILSSMGVKHVEEFNDSLLVVQQVAGVF
jgi:hypothetical protein